MGVFWLGWAVVAGATLGGIVLAARQRARWMVWAFAVGVMLGTASAAFVAWGEFGWRWSGPSMMFAYQSTKQAFSAIHRLLWARDGSPLFFAFILFELPVAVGRDAVNWVVGLLLWPFYARALPSAWPGAAVGMFLASRPLLAWAVWFVQGAIGGAALVVPFVGFLRLIDPSGDQA